MSPSHPGRRASAFREVKRAPQATTASATVAASPAATDDYATTVMASVPKSTTALAVVLSVFAVAILSICLWRYKVRRRRQRQNAKTEDALWRAASYSSFDSEKGKPLGLDETLEKPKQVYIPLPDNGEAGWKPQIKSYAGVPLKNGELPKHVQAAREGRKYATEWRNGPVSPPSYKEKEIEPNAVSDAPFNKHINVSTSGFPASRFSNPTPLTAVSEDRSESLRSPARSSSKHSHSRSRSVSFKHISGEVVTKMTPTEARHSRSGSASDIIRLMTVVNTFHPSLDDELSVKLGDCVRLVEEYHDGWCLCQHVGQVGAPRGVVPRFCLVDRHHASTKSSRKRSLTQSASKA